MDWLFVVCPKTADDRKSAANSATAVRTTNLLKLILNLTDLASNCKYEASSSFATVFKGELSALAAYTLRLEVALYP